MGDVNKSGMTVVKMPSKFHKSTTKRKLKSMKTTAGNELRSMTLGHTMKGDGFNNSLSHGDSDQKHKSNSLLGQKQKGMKKMIKHMFEFHLITEKCKDYKLDMLKIYFTI
jgi:hypothetical protein